MRRLERCQVSKRLQCLVRFMMFDVPLKSAFLRTREETFICLFR